MLGTRTPGRQSLDAGQAADVAGRISALGADLGAQAHVLSALLARELAERVPDLDGDTTLLHLLEASCLSNIETAAHVLQYDIASDNFAAPPAAVEYARRLAQHGVSVTALVRAYRIGQQIVLQWALTRLVESHPDTDLAIRAALEYVSRSFNHIDKLTEQVVTAYDLERERWQSHRRTVRAELLKAVLHGDVRDVAGTERDLDYRLRQFHLGAVVWADEPGRTPADLAVFGSVISWAAEVVGARGTALQWAKDRATAWVWFPLGRAGATVDTDALVRIITDKAPHIKLALGRPGVGADGFQRTHLEAVEAQRLSVIARGRAPAVTPFSDAGVRTAAMLARDLEGTRRLVAGALGSLAEDTEKASRLRETLMTFLANRGSFAATGEQLHLHKNTVKYRVDQALAGRGRPITDDRMEIELALLACNWLGPAVLLACGAGDRVARGLAAPS